ncbi:GNAT family N-acetyltransferase [Pseudonocardia yuanmonensis]|uniref:GNAT family N-acetyltransferase n=1 Tax=Pseudonocardia yuanmonensis TaxID=1095914 RepID=A0ABP8XVP8_9PSEU
MAHLRPYTAEDRDAVVALSLRAWEPVFASMRRVLAGSGVYEAFYPDWRRAQAEAVARACTELEAWVAEVDGRVAGFVALHSLDETTGEIHMVAVDPELQRHGVGRALTEHATTRLRARGSTVAMVETGGDPGHAPARALYEDCGYTPLPSVRYFRTL